MLDARARDILFHLVDTYLETRAPVGSLTLSKRLGMRLSAATVRGVMADLEALSLIASPHTSAGRLPTERGLRFVAQTFLEISRLSEDDQRSLEASQESRLDDGSHELNTHLQEVTSALAGLSACAGVVSAPQQDSGLKHVEFVPLQPGRALVVLVSTSGRVENRVIELPAGIMPFHLEAATNYLGTTLKNRRLTDVQRELESNVVQDKDRIDGLTARLASMGIALWTDDTKNDATQAASHAIVVRGQANLLKHVTDVEELHVLEELLQALEQKEGLFQLLGMAQQAQSVQLFIGADHALFQSNRCSAVVAPYQDAKGCVVGAVGVVGPAYMNYRRIIPMVDYTAHLLTRTLKGEQLHAQTKETTS